MPYKRFPKLMAVLSVEANITCINSFTKKNGIFNTLSPSATVLGTPKIDATHNILQTGSYLNYKVKSIRMNGMKTRSMV